MPVVTQAPAELPSIPLCRMDLTVVYRGECVFTPPILVEQARDEDFDGAPVSFDIDVTYDRSAYDAVTARARWVAAKLVLGGTRFLRDSGETEPVEDGEIITFARSPSLSFEESLTAGQQATVTFEPVGDQWRIPSKDFIPPEQSTCPSELVLRPRVPVRAFGNRPSELTLLIGKTPAEMIDFRLFQGQTIQKSTQGNIQIKGSITCLDDSILWVDHALCYQLPPFSGLRRGEITRQVAALIGLNPDTQVKCPPGSVFQKPILLSNGSILTFLNEFWAGENGFAFFNEFGQLEVQIIERKDAPDEPDWTLDEDLGDFFLDSWEEVPPSKPPTKIFVFVSQPVKGTGPGGSDLEITTVTTEEEQALYNPQCVKVRPSGADSHLLGDGSYHELAAEELMIVSRKTTSTTTRNGLEVLKVVKLEAFYNPLAYDPNFDTDPPGTAYDGAYGDKSFHRDEVERLTEISLDSFATLRDQYGTILQTTQETKSYYAIRRGGNYNTARTVLTNDVVATPPAYVYAGGFTSIEAQEVYRTVSQIVTDYFYGVDGALATKKERRFGYLTPTSRSDVLSITTTPDSGPPTDDSDPDFPPIPNPPPPPPPPTPPPFHPALSGPISNDGIGKYLFKLDASGMPTPGSGSASCTVWWARISPRDDAPIPAYGHGGGAALSTTRVLSNPVAVGTLSNTNNPGTIFSITFRGSKPNHPVYLYASVNVGGTLYFSNSLIVTPWDDLPPGGSFPGGETGELS